MQTSGIPNVLQTPQAEAPPSVLALITHFQRALHQNGRHRRPRISSEIVLQPFDGDELPPLPEEIVEDLTTTRSMTSRAKVLVLLLHWMMARLQSSQDLISSKWFKKV